jgi:ketosteroid isomerase-like protein
MTVQELAKNFTELLKRGDDEAAASKYNADDIVSYEAQEGPMAVCRGSEALKQKGEWWRANHEVHGGSVEGPYVNGDRFAIRLTYDLTPKSTGKRVTMEEVALYTVKNGKIIEERFFY